MKSKTILIALLMIIACLMGDYARDFELAQRYVALGKYDEAQEILEKLYSERPDNSRVRDMLKQVYRATKNNEALLEMIEHELSQNPKDPNIWVDAGQLYLSQGQADKAEDAFDTAVELAPENQGLILRIFAAYRSWGYIEKAIDLLENARKRADSDALYAMEIASLYEIQGKWEAAAEEYGKYLEKYPDRFRDVESRMNEVAADTTQLAALEKAVEKLRETGVQGDRIDRLLSRLQMRQGKYMQAARSLINAEDKRGEKGLYTLNFMREALAAGEHETVIFIGEYLQNAETRFAQEASLIMAISMRKAGKFQQAIAVLERLTKIDNRTIAAQAYTQLGSIYLYDLNDLDNAEEYFQIAIDKFGRIQGTGDAYRGLTDVHLRRGDFEAAEDVLNRRRTVAPQDPWALFGIGELSFFRGSTDTAAAIFRAVALSFPKSEEANNAVQYLALLVDAAQSEKLPEIAKAFKFKRQGRIGEAIALLDELIEKLGDQPWADYLVWTRAVLYRQSGNTADAKDDYALIVENYPESFYAPISLEKMGDMALAEDNYTTAVEHYNKILVDYPQSVNIERVREKMRDMPGNI